MPKACGKENNFGGKIDTNLPNHVEEKSYEVKEEDKGKIDDNMSLKMVRNPAKRKSNQEILKGKHNCSKEPGTKEDGSCGSKQSSKKSKRDKSDGINNNLKNDGEILKGGSPHGDEKKPKKSRKGVGGPHGDEKKQKKSRKEGGCPDSDEKKPKKSRKDRLGNNAPLDRRISPRKLNVPGVEKQGEKNNVEVDTEDLNKRMNIAKKGFLGPLENYMKKEDNIDTGDNKNFLKNHDLGFHADIPLPEGEAVNNVAGIDLQPEDVGNAFQFLEFCAVFGKASNFICNLI